MTPRPTRLLFDQTLGLAINTVGTVTHNLKQKSQPRVSCTFPLKGRSIHLDLIVILSYPSSPTLGNMFDVPWSN